MYTHTHTHTHTHTKFMYKIIIYVCIFTHLLFMIFVDGPVTNERILLNSLTRKDNMVL